MPRLIYPPHPAKAYKIPPTEVTSLEKQGGWVAQRKFNGSHMVGHLQEGVLTLWNRQGEPFTYYTLTPGMTECFNSLGLNGHEVVFDGELMHTKAKLGNGAGPQALTHTIILYDLLYFDRILFDLDFSERYELLSKICGNPTAMEPKNRGFIVSQIDGSQLWLAELFKDDFEYRFYEMYHFDKNKNDLFPEIEGLVLKREKGSYLSQGNKPYDVDWMMRVRKPKKIWGNF